MDTRNPFFFIKALVHLPLFQIMMLEARERNIQEKFLQNILKEKYILIKHNR